MNKKIKDYCDIMNISYRETSDEVVFYQMIGDYVEYDFLRVPIEYVEFYPENFLKDELICAVKNDDHLNIPTSGRFKWGED